MWQRFCFSPTIQIPSRRWEAGGWTLRERRHMKCYRHVHEVNSTGLMVSPLNPPFFPIEEASFTDKWSLVVLCCSSYANKFREKIFKQKKHEKRETNNNIKYSDTDVIVSVMIISLNTKVSWVVFDFTKKLTLILMNCLVTYLLIYAQLVS